MVVLITGAADRDLSVRALRGGAYDFIQKPIDRDYFVASLGSAIKVRQLRREVAEQRHALERYAASLEEAVSGSDLVVMGVPSHGFRDVLTELAPYVADGTPVLSLFAYLTQAGWRHPLEVNRS